ncbi:MAG: lipopolysaccharide biosynthesis protein [Cyanobacteria bacterium]|nr:lipopolysaccharide biosynthesis protein [Cyanobacteriota bacterium]
MSYSKTTFKGVTWVAGFNGVNKLITTGRLAILARILTPAQFGVFGIVSFVLAFIEMLTETGINIFLIQEESEIDNFINTAWIISILRGLLIAFIIIIFAPLISSFFNSPSSLSLLYFSSLIPVVRGFINPSEVNFQKRLEFRKEFYFRTFLIFIDSAVSVLFALTTKNVSSFIWGLLISAMMEAILSFILLKPIPKFKIDKSVAKNVISRGKWVTAAGVFNYSFHNLDNMVVGKMLGITALGFYQNAYKISVTPLNTVSDIISRVTLPVYVKIGTDINRLRRAFFRTLAILFILLAPVSVLLFIFAKEVVLIVLGPDWLSGVDIFKVLVILGFLNTVSGYASSLFFSLKKQHYVTVVTFATFIGMFGAIIPLVAKFGVLGAGYAGIIGVVISLPFFIYYIHKIFVKERLIQGEEKEYNLATYSNSKK